MRTALSIAGSDCSGGAGIQADLKTFSALGVFGMTVITSVVAENTSRVISVQDIDAHIIEDQIDALFEDIPPGATKIGMLSCSKSMLVVAEKLKQWQPANVVLDPVMYAKNGSPLMDPPSIDTLITQVIPLVDLVTPNLPEAEMMTHMSISTQEDMQEAARRIQRMGCKAVLVKGGHSAGDATDILFDGKEFSSYSTPRINTKNTHGTGCTYSAAIAAGLARGLCLSQAVAEAKAYVTTAIAHALDLGKGHGPTHHFYDLYKHGLQQKEQQQ